MNVDTAPRTLAVALLIALACSAMVSAAVYLLRSIQQGYELVDRNRTILEAAGVLPPGAATDREIINRFLALEAHVVDLDSGEYLPDYDAHAFDHWRHAAEDLPAQESGTPSARRAPVYILRQDGELRRLVLPVAGAGMWDTIYGYIALEPDLTTVADLVIYRHGETAGIGDRIEDPGWLAEWRGKRIYGNDGEVRIAVGRQAEAAHGVDLITGASVTSEAVGDFVHQWFGDEGYRQYLDTLRLQEAG